LCRARKRAANCQIAPPKTKQFLDQGPNSLTFLEYGPRLG
jgi:hypothetical protein